MIKLRILRWEDYSRLSEWALNAMIYIFMKERQLKIWKTQRRRLCEDRVEWELKVPALKIGMVQPQAKEFHQQPEFGRGKNQIIC